MIGQQIGPYSVLSKLGAGGMGEVYRARDSKLNRDVALKVLPAFLAGDPERLGRFRREAQVLAALNHPNIGHIYGFEDSGSMPALVLELVEGPTLADRILRGPMPVGDALQIARQIVDGLEAAHEQGVIHRDLKPANIKVKDDGTVKVLDFGLAKALATQGAAGSEAALNSPTMSARATEMGMILGTAAYMSPEQAKGKTADQRADVWAFGVVLFEMLSGKQVFTGETASEVMASVMKEEPDWSQLPSNLSPALRRLLRRCLEKDPKKRMSAMSDVRLELNEKDIAVADAAAVAGAPGSKLMLLAATAVGAVVTAIGFLASGSWQASAPERAPARVAVLGPEGVSQVFDASESAISPDGRTLVFSAADRDGRSRLWIRPLDSLEARALDGTETAIQPFWSPDSSQIAFFAGGKLKKVPALGGTIEELCAARDARGGAWGSQNIIVFAPSNAGALMTVSGNGGEPKPATALDAARGETGHRFPSFLPDGRHFLFAALPMKNLQFDLFVGSLDDTTVRTPVGTAEGAAVYADPGYIIFPRKGVLFAQPFDAANRRTTSEPVAIGDAPSATGGLYSAGRAVTASSTGTLAYLGDRLPDTDLVWLNRNGVETGRLSAPEGRYQELAISPDGKRAAIVRFTTQADTDIWMADVARGGATRFTTERALNIDVVWSPDSTRVVFAADTAGPRDLFIKPASGATLEKSLYASPALFKDSVGWSPDGKFVMFEELNPKTQDDIWMLPTDGGAPKVYLQTPYNEGYPTFSHDSKWVAYTSDESGRMEIYVDAFPEPRHKIKVSQNGAIKAWWRGDSKELVFVNADNRSVSTVDVTLGATLTIGAPKKLFDLAKAPAAISFTRDHSRALVALPKSDILVSRMTLVFDWVGLLTRK